MRKPLFDIKWRELREGDLVTLMTIVDVNGIPTSAGRTGLVIGVHPQSELTERVSILCDGEIHLKMPGQLTVISDGPLAKI